MSQQQQKQYRPQRKPKGRIERLSEFAAKHDRQGPAGAHARHLARLHGWEMARWALISWAITGIGAAVIVVALTAGSWLGLLALALWVVAVLDRELGRHPELATRLGVASLVNYTSWRWTAGLAGAGALCALLAVDFRATTLVIGAGIIGAGIIVRRLKVQPARIARIKAQVGAARESSVAATLDGVVRVKHSVMLGAGGDADHVVCSASGQVAVVETKSGGGRVSIGGDGRIIKGGSAIMGDPVEQVLRQAAALSRLAYGATIDAIVCVAGQSNPPFVGPNGVVICGERHLARVVAGLPRRLTPPEADAVFARLP